MAHSKPASLELPASFKQTSPQIAQSEPQLGKLEAAVGIYIDGINNDKLPNGHQWKDYAITTSDPKHKLQFTFDSGNDSFITIDELGRALAKHGLVLSGADVSYADLQAAMNWVVQQDHARLHKNRGKLEQG